MKPSRYNYLFKVRGSAVLAYNTLTTALVSLDDQESDQWQAFLADPRPDFFDARGLLAWRDQLLETGLVVHDDDDELARIQATRLALRDQAPNLLLTILPTLNCNFRCKYCFSYARPAVMGPDVQDALLRFVEERLRDAQELSIAWYGGEPTLCLDLIEDLTSRLRSLCEKRQAKMQPGSIVTNGYLLSRVTAERLKKAGISEVQVTLDGDRETHNARRPLADGRGTFDQIVHNISECHNLLEMQVRINVDRSNARSALGALDALAAQGVQSKAGVYFGHVKQYTEACGDIASSCLSDREFSEIDLALRREALRRGFASFPYPNLRLAGACSADKDTAHVIAPDGLLFKCWAEASLGTSTSVGSLLRPARTPAEEENLQRYLSWDPTATEACQQCRLLPICMGGCPHERIRRPSELSCSTWRYSLLETLGIRYVLGGQNPIFEEQGQGEPPG